MFFKIVSIIAAILTTGAFLPQAIKTIKTKDTSGISFIMYLMSTTGVLLWVVYGFHIKDVAITTANIITFIFASIILGCKANNMRNGRDK